MTGPNNNNDNELIEQNTDYFVTTTTIKRTISIERLMTLLRARKTTGDLCFHMIDGGIRRIELNERTKATEEERDRIREILKME